MSECKKDLKYWKNNCEEDYLTTPISVLRYISKLEEQLTIPNVVKSFFCNNERSKEGKCFEQCGVCSEYASR